MFFGYGAFMMLGWLLLLTGIVVLGFAFFKKDAPSEVRSSALEILKERYARGEISVEEYQKMRAELEK